MSGGETLIVGILMATILAEQLDDTNRAVATVVGLVGLVLAAAGLVRIVVGA